MTHTTTDAAEALTCAAWKAEYVRLAMVSRFKLSEADAREEADASWDSWSGECPPGEPMLPPADALREDMLEWEVR